MPCKGSIKMIEELKEWLSFIVGKKLKSVYGLIYFFAVGDTNHPQELQVVFEAAMIKKISCSSDGATMLIQDSPMIESELGEYGKQLIRDISDMPPFERVIGEELHGVDIITSGVEQGVVGLRFKFSNSKKIDILTLGDEISFYEMTPLKIIEEEGLSFLSIYE